MIKLSVYGFLIPTMKPYKSRELRSFLLLVFTFSFLLDLTTCMSAEEKRSVKDRVLELFYHAYNAYMNNAYPADELMPLSCKGRYRGSEQSRGDVDDTLGNFTLTLIDSMDTLAVLGDVQGFEEAVRNIMKDARFDCDVIVSVFETNIRILGGLLGGHVMAWYLKRRGLGMSWYNDELLSRAKEVGDRLLPAFNTSTGIPYPRINLKHGIVSHISSSHHDTCTACAGSMILEFAALSRLTGISIYEEKARRAMDYLWQQRHRGSDLMGTIINVHSGDWIRRESGVGAGIDSYYEYVLKAYILLGDDHYLDRFNKHYTAVMRYVSQGPLLVDVHMHKPNSVSRNFMDALLAFWPGLQVLKGDLVPAIETHEMLYQVMQRHNFIPEAFTTDFRVHWGHHPLRPEFIESTYFLYKATGDSYYLDVGKKVLDNLEQHARVACGLAAIKNVKTGAHEDQMDSYVLAEMFKYLYLLFAEKEDLIIDIDDFIFTTEAHLLPLTLSVGNASSPLPKINREVYSFDVGISPLASNSYVTSLGEEEKFGQAAEQEENPLNSGDHMCPALHTTHASGHRYPHTVRSQIRDIVGRVSPHRQSNLPRLRAIDFIAGNKEQLEQLHAMGIRIATMVDGRIQLLHTASEAHSPEDAENGMQFMQEMIELSKQQQTEAQHDPMFVHVRVPGLKDIRVIRAGPAQFGYNLRENKPLSGLLAIARPYRACEEIENVQELASHIVILERGDCMFIDKARNLQRVGALAGIVIDHTEGSTSDSQPLFAMSGDGTNDVKIPVVFLYHTEGKQLLQQLADNSFLQVTLAATSAIPAQSAFDPVATTGPVAVQPSGGAAEEAEPLPAANHQPKLPTADSSISSDSEQDIADAFSDLLDDKFYHHEAQLRDLYYLQAGSRYLHLNVEVRPSATEPPPLDQREKTCNIDVLPDNSKMVTVRLTYQSSGYDDKKPHLHQLYLDTVQLLQLNSNFLQLPHTTDYLRALARCLEAGYFGLNQIDSDVLTLLRGLSRQLQYVHQFPAKPDRPVLKDTATQAGSIESLGDFEKSYAVVSDFVEPPPEGKRAAASDQGIGGEDKDWKADGSNQFVRFVPMEEEQNYAAHVDKEGKLNLVKDPSDHSVGEQPNAFSVHLSSSVDKDSILVNTLENDDRLTQSQTCGDGQLQSPSIASVQSGSSDGETDHLCTSSNSQPSSSGMSSSETDSSSHVLSHSDTEDRSESIGGTKYVAGDETLDTQSAVQQVPHNSVQFEPSTLEAVLVERQSAQGDVEHSEDSAFSARSKPQHPDDEL